MTHVTRTTAKRFCTVGFKYVGIPFALWLQSNCDGMAAMLVVSMVARFLLVRCVAIPVMVEALDYWWYSSEVPSRVILSRTIKTDIIVDNKQVDY